MVDLNTLPLLDSVEPVIRVPGCPPLRLKWSALLHHSGDCALIGVDRAGRVALEEYYDDWLAQYLFNRTGQLIAICDEDEGRAIDPEPIPDHDLFIGPPSVGAAVALNYTAGRWRGLREEDRVAEMAQPLTIPEKIGLARLGIPTPILGLAESYVLAEAAITPQWSVVVQRLRVAFAVPLNMDEDGDAYDYDSIPIYIARWFDPNAESTALTDHLIALGTRPMDAQYAIAPDGDRLLYIADGGEAPRLSALHLYHVE